MNKSVQIYELSALIVDDNPITNRHFEKLALFNERHGNKYFTLGYRRIHFHHYVGVIQVDDLTIEILPKADVLLGGKQKWRNALLNMLRECGYLKIDSISNAKLKLKGFTLLELYIQQFLNEVENIIHSNLVKNYYHKQGNLPKLKGRLLFEKQISRNYLHKERFYTSHQIYDNENILNTILKRALEEIQYFSLKKDIILHSKELLNYFDDIRGVFIDLTTVFSKIKLKKANQHYREALKYAQLILLKSTPSMNSGQEDIIAILFDMNLLFERFFYSQLKKCEESFEHRQLSILGQVSKEFWNSKTIRPDILLEYDIKDKKRVIIDTKWKILDSIYPSDTDLKQMYTYNLHFDANKSVLVYPYTSIDTNVPIRYVPSLSIQKEHYCQTYCVNIFDEKGNIRKSFAKEFIENILN